MAVARAYGAKKIIAFDIEQSRVDFAVKNYADHGVLCPKDKVDDPEPSAKEFVTSKLKNIGIESGVDMAIEVTGVESAALMAVFALRAQGTCKLEFTADLRCENSELIDSTDRCASWTTLESPTNTYAPCRGKRADPCW
jgi:Zn-dependent alcohol dehydrogenase